MIVWGGGGGSKGTHDDLEFHGGLGETGFRVWGSGVQTTRDGTAGSEQPLVVD